MGATVWEGARPGVQVKVVISSAAKTPVDTRVLTDAIERAVMQIVYADLDRDPSIPSTEKPIRGAFGSRGPNWCFPMGATVWEGARPGVQVKVVISSPESPRPG
jgi:predicted small integral membrane protein